jgi:hypothetical protein
LPQARIMAVEMFRGPDHMAMRFVTLIPSPERNAENCAMENFAEKLNSNV